MPPELGEGIFQEWYVLRQVLRRIAATVSEWAVRDVFAEGKGQAKRVEERRRWMRRGMEELEGRMMLSGAATQLVFLPRPTTVKAGGDLAIAVAVEDDAGNVVTSDKSVVMVTIGGFPLTLSGANGIYSNDISFTASADYVVTAVDAADGLTATPENVSIVAAAPAKIVFKGQPSNFTAGQNFSWQSGPTFGVGVVVDETDIFGNIVTADNSSNVTLGTWGSPSYLLGTTTLQLTNGEAKFMDVTLDRQGCFTLMATAGCFTVESNSFSVSPGAAAKLEFGQLMYEQIAGTVVTPGINVGIEDQFGNIIAGKKSNITLSTTNGVPILGTTTVAAVKGIASFGNVTINVADVYTLSAVDTTDGITGTGWPLVVSAAAPTQLVLLNQVVTASANTTIGPIRVAMEDAFGNVVQDKPSVVSLSLLSYPITGSPGCTTYAGTLNGIAEFDNVSAFFSGRYVLQANESGNALVVTSAPFIVGAEPARQIGFLVQPANMYLGDVMSTVTVLLQGASGNVATGDNSSVTLSMADGSGNLGGTLTVQAVNGVASFKNLVPSQLGTYQLSVVDTFDNLFGQSGNFTVMPKVAGVPVGLKILQQPFSGNVGVPLSTVKVEVVDVFGNLVTSSSDSITIAPVHSVIDVPPMSGTLTVQAVNGVATFNNLIVDFAGVENFFARDNTDNATVNGQSIQISAAPATTLTVFQQPTTAVAGAQFFPLIDVGLEDQFGDNIGSGVPVTISVQSGPGALTGNVTQLSGGLYTNLVLTKAGMYTLAASAPSVGVSVVLPQSVTVTAGAAAKLVFVGIPAHTVAGAVIGPSVQVQVQDLFGNVVTTDNSTITLALAGAGSLGGTLMEQAVNGVATFGDLSITRSGIYQLSAVDPALGTNATVSSGFSIDAATATQAGLGIVPATLVAGKTFSVAVTLRDVYGNVAASSTPNLLLQVLDANGAAVGAAIQPASLTQGVATFSGISFKTVGTYMLRVTSNGGYSVDSSAISVSADNNSPRLVFVQEPTSGLVGSAISPTVVVDIEDQFGNVLTTNETKVTLKVASGPSALLTGLTVTAVDGVATFSNLALSAAGNFTLQATDVGIPAAISTSFVERLPATHLVFGTQPAGIVAGGVMGTVTVIVEDAKGAAVGVDGSTVTLALLNGGGATLGGTLSAVVKNGVATFTGLTMSHAGNYQLAASDAALVGTVSGNFAVTADVGSAHLVAGPLVDLPLGTAGTINVAMEDQFGNVVTADKSIVTVAVLSGPAGGKVGGTLKVTLNAGVGLLKGLTYSLTGTYVLRASAGAGFADVTQVVGVATTSVAAPVVTVAGYAFGAAINLSATLKSTAASSVAFTGTASILDQEGNVVGTAGVVANGAVKWTLSGLAGGTYTYHVHYAGDANHSAADSVSFTVKVNPAATTVGLKTSAGTVVFGQDVTLTATVGTGTIATLPTGTVTFMDGTVVVGSVTLTGGKVAAVMVTRPTVGTHKYTAVYSGDGNFKTSVSSAGSVTVGKDSVTALPVAGAGGPVVVGQDVTLTAAFALKSPSVGVPTGMATFKDGGKVIGTAVLDGNGNAQLVTHFATAGNHSITVSYGGDATSNTATSTTFVQSVTKAATSVLVSGPAGTVSAGTKVTLTVNVSLLLPGAGAGTGSVQIKEGSKILATVVLKNGAASWTSGATTFAVGEHTITVAYLGDSNDLASVSDPLGLTVG